MGNLERIMLWEVLQSVLAIKAGRISVYDAELKGNFDATPREKLIVFVGMWVADRSVLGSIRGWLLFSFLIECDDRGKQQSSAKSDRGTPQGGGGESLLCWHMCIWTSPTRGSIVQADKVTGPPPVLLVMRMTSWFFPVIRSANGRMNKRNSGGLARLEYQSGENLGGASAP